MRARLTLLLSVLCVSNVATAEDAESPKVAVVVAGDPEEDLRIEATELQADLKKAGLRGPVDGALRGALIGESPPEDDGLNGLRAARRSLGLEPKKDLATYKRIGTISGADALVVVHRQGEIVGEVFDVPAGQFYEGVLNLQTTSSQEQVKFIERRAVEAKARWAVNDAATGGAVADATRQKPNGEPVDESKKKKRIKKAWPWILVGALAAGGIAYLVVSRRNDGDSGPPVLRFGPGAD